MFSFYASFHHNKTSCSGLFALPQEVIFCFRFFEALQEAYALRGISLFLVGGIFVFFFFVGFLLRFLAFFLIINILA